MTEATKPQATPTRATRHWVVELVLAAVALGVASIAINLAIDSGALLHYGITLLFIGLAARHLVLSFKSWKAKQRG